MAMIRQDFQVTFEVNSIGSIKAWKAGETQGNKFPPSVKFRATNMETKQDPDVGLREIETIVDFQVKTSTLEEAVKLQELIRRKRDKNETIYLSGNLPNKDGADDILTIKSIEPLKDFMVRNKFSWNSLKD